MTKHLALARTLTSILLLGLALVAGAQEATIRKNLAERLPNMPKIDEVTKTPMPGLYEVRFNQSEIFYTDADGNYVLHGAMIDTRARQNLTEARVEKLTAVDFDELPFKDAFTIVRGNGKRKLVIFEDPNCGYCKRFERDIARLGDVTIHVFLYPVLGPDSNVKSQAIWCAKDRGKSFEDWMLRNVTPATANCDTGAISRNLAFGRKHRIMGTPTLFLADGTRVPGALPADKVEQMLASIK